MDPRGPTLVGPRPSPRWAGARGAGAGSGDERILPAVNEGVSYQDEVAPGDVIAVGEGITFVPEPGWGITSGVRLGDAPAGGQYPNTATVVDGDVTFTVRADVFDGEDDALLTRLRRRTGSPRTNARRSPPIRATRGS